MPVYCLCCRPLLPTALKERDDATGDSETKQAAAWTCLLLRVNGLANTGTGATCCPLGGVVVGMASVVVKFAAGGEW